MALKTILAALGVTASLAAGTAFAADPAPAPATPGAKAALARQAHFKDLNAAFGGLNAELRKDASDKALVAAGAGKVKALAEDLPSWFPKGSGPEAGVKTQARAEIWTDAAGFATAVTKLQAGTAKLQDLAAAGDLDAVKTQTRATGGACKACHDAYRAQEPR